MDEPESRSSPERAPRARRDPSHITAVDDADDPLLRLLLRTGGDGGDLDGVGNHCDYDTLLLLQPFPGSGGTDATGGASATGLFSDIRGWDCPDAGPPGEDGDVERVLGLLCSRYCYLGADNETTPETSVAAHPPDAATSEWGSLRQPREVDGASTRSSQRTASPYARPPSLAQPTPASPHPDGTRVAAGDPPRERAQATAVAAAGDRRARSAVIGIRPAGSAAPNDRRATLRPLPAAADVSDLPDTGPHRAAKVATANGRSGQTEAHERLRQQSPRQCDTDTGPESNDQSCDQPAEPPPPPPQPCRLACCSGVFASRDRPCRNISHGEAIALRSRMRLPPPGGIAAARLPHSPRSSSSSSSSSSSASSAASLSSSASSPATRLVSWSDEAHTRTYRQPPLLSDPAARSRQHQQQQQQQRLPVLYLRPLPGSPDSEGAGSSGSPDDERGQPTGLDKASLKALLCDLDRCRGDRQSRSEVSDSAIPAEFSQFRRVVEMVRKSRY
ncbi:hypothetical protein HK405_001657 [Cladochytrium tenue]|nr:hypothetical protein HK405_001657 [Cladochytrium tenue]